MLTKKEIQAHRGIFDETDKKIVAAFKVLSDLNRFRIFRILAQQPKLSVSNIAHILDISVPLASQHIKVLLHADIVQKERKGKKVFPRLDHEDPFVQVAKTTIQEVLKPKGSHQRS